MMLLLFAAASIGGAPPPAQTAASAKVADRSPALAQALVRFEAAVAAERTAFDALPAAGGIGANLKVRIALEQAMRRAVDPALEGLTGDGRTAASGAIWQRIERADAANTAYVKSIVPRDGWFRQGRDGADVARDAWLIVQHSPDQAFQRDVLARMRPLLASGEVRGADYALLYDRTEVFAGRPQLYGSQMTCSEGRWQVAPTVDPAALDRRRAEMGLEPMAEYRKAFEGGC